MSKAGGAHKNKSATAPNKVKRVDLTAAAEDENSLLACVEGREEDERGQGNVERGRENRGKGRE